MKWIAISLLLTTALLAQPTKLLKTETKVLIAQPDMQFMAPEWAPDGSALAFTTTKYQGLWVKQTNQQQVTKLSNLPAIGFGFCWSPDSHYLLTRGASFKQFRRYNQIDLISLSDGKITGITGPTTEPIGIPAWVSTAGEIAFTQKGNLQVKETGLKQPKFVKAALPTRDKIQIFSTGVNKDDALLDLNDSQVIDPALSPDGTKLAYQKIGGPLYIKDMVSGENVEVGFGHRPRWSPNGKYVVYMVTEDDGHQMTAADLYICTADGNKAYRLTQTNDLLEMNPSWAPDGNTIVFDADGAIYELTILDEL